VTRRQRDDQVLVEELGRHDLVAAEGRVTTASLTVRTPVRRSVA
jgi:hypothetical protein